MKKYWANFSARERSLIIAAALLLLVLLAGQFVVRPLAAFPKSAHTAHSQAQSDLKAMKTAVQSLALRPPAPPRQIIASAEFQSVVTALAAKNGLEISRRQPKGETMLNVWLDDVSAKSLYGWLAQLRTQYRLDVPRAVVTANDNGTVRAQITLQRQS